MTSLPIAIQPSVAVKFGRAVEIWRCAHLDNRVHVVTDHDQDIVNPVVTPHPLSLGGTGKSKEAVVSGIDWVVDPRIVRPQMPHRRLRGLWLDPNFPVEPKTSR